MLVELNISNFAVISELKLALGPGLTVFTGEAGAGKSILVDALSFLLGGRASRTFLRRGCESARVEGRFLIDASSPLQEKIAAAGMDDTLPTGELVLARDLPRDGPASCRVNGRLTTLAFLRELAEELADFHGQHEHQSLLKVSQHRVLLDRMGGEPLARLVARMEELQRRFQALRHEAEELRVAESERARQMDWLRFEAREIDQGALVAGEEAALRAEVEVLEHHERLAELAAQSLFLLEGGSEFNSLDTLRRVAGNLERMAGWDGRLTQIAHLAANLVAESEEVYTGIREYSENLGGDTGRLDQVNARLLVIEGLKKKYGASLEEITAYRDSLERKLSGLESTEDRRAQIARELVGLDSERRETALVLSGERRRQARELEQGVNRELVALGMEAAHFKVSFHPAEIPTAPLDDPRAAEIGIHGLDGVEFLISTNPGEDLMGLHRIASGGELSRIMLAQKAILAGLDGISTMVFDEIDAGLGGRDAEAVAVRLARLAGGRQVLCISHLPVIAAGADRHVVIEKQVRKGRTTTRARVVDGEERVREIAGMLGGKSISEVTLEHAREMLQRRQGRS